VTSSWFFLSALNYDARSTTHQIDCVVCDVGEEAEGTVWIIRWY